MSQAEVGPTRTPSTDGHCSICGDEATIARVTSIDFAMGTAEVTRDSCTSTVSIDLLDGLALGGLVLVHMGFAISLVNEGSLE